MSDAGPPTQVVLGILLGGFVVLTLALTGVSAAIRLLLSRRMGARATHVMLAVGTAALAAGAVVFALARSPQFGLDAYGEEAAFVILSSGVAALVDGGFARLRARRASGG